MSEIKMEVENGVKLNYNCFSAHYNCTSLRNLLKHDMTILIFKSLFILTGVVFVCKRVYLTRVGNASSLQKERETKRTPAGVAGGRLVINCNSCSASSSVGLWKENTFVTTIKTSQYLEEEFSVFRNQTGVINFHNLAMEWSQNFMGKLAP